jgi:Aldo/keto reductase family
MAALGRTDLDVFPICLGGNVFGWTADEPQSRDVLDAYVGAGGNFIDTANSFVATTLGWLGRRKDAWERPRKLLTGLLGLLLDVELDAFARTGIAM